MTVLVYIMGALLVLAGAMFIAMGVPVVRLEIGWSEVIGGSVAGSAGFVVLALAVVLTRLDALRSAVLSLNIAGSLRAGFGDSEAAWEERGAQLFPPLAPVPAPVAPATPPRALPDEPRVEPEPALEDAPLHLDAPELPEEPASPPPAAAADPTPELAEGAPALLPDEDHAPPLPPVEALPPEVLIETAESPPVPPPPAEPGRTRPNFLAAFLARRSAAAVAQRTEPPTVERPLHPLRGFEEEEPPARTPVDLSSGWGDAEPVPPTAFEAASAAPYDLEPASAVEQVPAEAAEVHAQEPDAGPRDEPGPAAEPETPAPAEEEPLKPVVVGRYNAGSASYIMYSNGMIEVETDSGTHQFASMQDLKAFIERRDAARA